MPGKEKAEKTVAEEIAEKKVAEAEATAEKACLELFTWFNNEILTKDATKNSPEKVFTPDIAQKIQEQTNKCSSKIGRNNGIYSKIRKMVMILSLIAKRPNQFNSIMSNHSSKWANHALSEELKKQKGTSMLWGAVRTFEDRLQELKSPKKN